MFHIYEASTWLMLTTKYATNGNIILRIALSELSKSPLWH